MENPAKICDICDKECYSSEQAKEWQSCDYAKLTAHWGYFSDRDCQQHECIICERCYEGLLSYILLMGGKVRGEYYLVEHEKFEVKPKKK